MMTRTQAEALATFIAKVRPDWDHPGIVAAISKAQAKATPLQVARALVNLAENSDLRTPAMLAEKGQHWRDGMEPTGPNASHDVRCPEHPTHAHPCPDCATKRTPPLPDYLEAKKALTAKTKPKAREPKPLTSDVTAARERIDGSQA